MRTFSYIPTHKIRYCPFLGNLCQPFTLKIITHDFLPSAISPRVIFPQAPFFRENIIWAKKSKRHIICLGKKTQCNHYFFIVSKKPFGLFFGKFGTPPISRSSAKPNKRL